MKKERVKLTKNSFVASKHDWRAAQAYPFAVASRKLDNLSAESLLKCKYRKMNVRNHFSQCVDINKFCLISRVGTYLIVSGWQNSTGL